MLEHGKLQCVLGKEVDIMTEDYLFFQGTAEMIRKGNEGGKRSECIKQLLIVINGKIGIQWHPDQ